MNITLTKKSDIKDVSVNLTNLTKKEIRVLCERAVELGLFEIAKYILEEFPKEKIKEVALARAIDKSNFEFVKYMIEKDVNINWNKGYILVGLCEKKTKMGWIKYILENNKTKATKDTLEECLLVEEMNSKVKKYLREMIVKLKDDV